jgi:hypothetical protein
LRAAAADFHSDRFATSRRLRMSARGRLRKRAERKGVNAETVFLLITPGNVATRAASGDLCRAGRRMRAIFNH